MGIFNSFLDYTAVLWVVFQNLCLIPGYLFLNWFIFLPVRIFRFALYDKIESTLFAWSLYIVAGWVSCGRTRVSEYGADISKDTKSSGKKPKILLVANHQSTADVPSIMLSMTSHPEFNVMWIISADFKCTHFGLVSWTHGDYFITEQTHVKGDLLVHCLKPRLRSRNLYLLFPEGGFRYKRAVGSDRYAAKTGLPSLHRVVWPRLGAFEELVSPDMGLTHIVDVTIIYPDHTNPPSMLNLFKWTEELSVCFLYRIFEIVSDETVDVEETAENAIFQCVRKVQQKNIGPDWLQSVWQEKEQLLEVFYSDQKAFFNTYGNGRRVKLNYCRLILVRLFIFGVFILIVFTFYWIFVVIPSWLYEKLTT